MVSYQKVEGLVNKLSYSQRMSMDTDKMQKLKQRGDLINLQHQN